MVAPSRGEAAPPPVAATVHIYRGLMDRAYTWRVRIDNPTNWAVVTSGAVTSLVLGDSAISQAVLLLAMFFNFSFLLIEARRYRYYDLWGTWVRLLETDFFATALLDNQVTLGEAWHKLLVQEMTYPHFKTSLLNAVGRRLRDNYLVIFLFLLFTWLLKLIVHPGIDTAAVGGSDILQAAAVGPIPGEWIFSAVSGSYALLFLVALLTSGEREPSVEVVARERILRKLASPYQQPVSRRNAFEQLPPEYIRAHSSTERSTKTRPVDLED